jgi:hypothetical protein
VCADSGVRAPTPVPGPTRSSDENQPYLELYSPVDLLTLYRTNKIMRKYRGDTSIENQLKIDKFSQNRFQSIEKIQNLLHLTLLNVKKV